MRGSMRLFISHPHRKALHLCVVLSIVLMLSILLPHAVARAITPTTLIPIGAGYETATLELFAARAAAGNSDSVVQLRLLPTPYASDPFWISPAERQDNYNTALTRADQVLAACQAQVTPPTTCAILVPDIQVRSDAFDQAKVALLDATVDGVYIVGGDQTVTMQVLANTPAEDALELLYMVGAPIGGNSAGAGIQSRYMIAGYTGNNNAWNGLEYGSVELWYDPIGSSFRGLRFGLQESVIEQHVLERGRLPRLLQAAQRLPTNSRIGMGVDWGTGAVIDDGQIISSIAGAYVALVADLESYGAADAASYVGPHHTLAMRNTALHVLPPGGYGYDFGQRRPIVNGQIDPMLPDIQARNLALVCAPTATAAPLLITGDLGTDPVGVVTQRFAAQAQATGGPTLILAAGFAHAGDALAEALLWKSDLMSLGVDNVQTAILVHNTDLETLAAQLAAATALFITGDDQVIMADQVAALTSFGIDDLLAQRWQAGVPMLFDNAAAAAVGGWMSAEPTPLTQEEVEIQASESFLTDHIAITPGLALLPDAVFEPRVSYDYLYGRLVSHAVTHPTAVAFGIQRGSAIEVTPQAARFLGDGAVLAVDGRFAHVLGSGSNNAWAATWLFVDTYAGNDVLADTACPHNHATLSINFHYLWNNGETGDGIFYLAPDGTFVDQDGHDGNWGYSQPNALLWLRHGLNQDCEALRLARLDVGGSISGLQICTDGSGGRGVWSGVLQPITNN